MNKNTWIILLIIGILILSSFSLPTISEDQEIESIDEDNVESTRTLADSPWPCYRGSAQRNGLSEYDTSDNPGKLKWKFNIGGYWGVLSSPAIDSKGILYVSSPISIDSEDGILYAIYPNGTEKWRIETINCVSYFPTIGHDGTIYVGDVSHLYAIDPNGSIKWKNAGASPVIDSEGIIYAILPGSLIAIYPDGKEKWSIPLGEEILCAPALGSDGTIYITVESMSYSYDIYAIYPNGTLKWKYDLDSPPDTMLAIGLDDTVYLVLEPYYGVEESYLYAINPNGTEKWRYNGETKGTANPAVDADGTVYVCFGNFRKGYYLHAIEPNGKKKWRIKIDNGFSSPVVGAKGTIYIGCDDYFKAIKDDGKEKWKVNLEKHSSISSPAIGSDGTLYICPKFDLYAIGKNTSSPPIDLQTNEGDGYVELSWKVPMDNGGTKITEYKIYRNTSFGNRVLIGSQDGSKTSYQDKDVDDGQFYIYYVTAVNEIGESAYCSNVLTCYGQEELIYSIKDPARDVMNETEVVVGGNDDVDITKVRLSKGDNYLLFELNVVGNVRNAVKSSNGYVYCLYIYLDENDNIKEIKECDFELYYALGLGYIENKATGEKQFLQGFGAGTSELKISIPLSFIDNTTDFRIMVTTHKYININEYGQFDRTFGDWAADEKDLKSSDNDDEDLFSLRNFYNQITIIIIIILFIIGIIIGLLLMRVKKKKETFECSECGSIITENDKFCPNCKETIDDDENEDDIVDENKSNEVNKIGVKDG